MNSVISLAVFFPIVAGFLLLCLPKKWMVPGEGDPNINHGKGNRLPVLIYSGITLLIGGILAVAAVLKGFGNTVTFLKLTDTISLRFCIDGMGRIFALVVCVIWILAAVFSWEYMKHEANEKRYYGFYLVTFGVLLGLDFSGDLITMYFFYEMMTLASVPLVFHTGTREAIMAGLKYLFYSFAGAYMALFGLFFLYKNCDTLQFAPGGALNLQLLEANGQYTVVLIAVFLMIIGYGVKAGMFPLHAWLTTAHPVAPAPASAVLSGVIVKSGVLALIRVIFYCVGADFIRGTWVQYTWIVLALITVFMGSMLAWREKVLKKRLAYSTVSQLSYILAGIAVLQPEAMTGAVLHVIFHAIIKTALFLAAGAFIFHTGEIRVEKFVGIGKKLPVILWCYTFAALSLIGIPPFSGFVGKWYLATGALKAQGIGGLRFAVPVVLLISALLTAAYLLPVTIDGFLPGNSFDYEALSKEKTKEPFFMVISLLALAGLTLLLGLFPNPVIGEIRAVIGGLM